MSSKMLYRHYVVLADFNEVRKELQFGLTVGSIIDS